MTIKKNINYIVKYNEIDDFMNEKSLIEFNKKNKIKEIDLGFKIAMCESNKNLSLLITLMKTRYYRFYKFFVSVVDFSNSIEDIEYNWDEEFKGLPYVKYIPNITIKYFNK